MNWFEAIRVGLCIGAGILTPFVAWYGIHQLRWIGIGELVLRRQMRQAGSFMPWNEVATRLERGIGEFELRRVDGRRGRFWYWPNGYMAEPALLTDCPMKYTDARRLRSAFPIARVRVTHPF